MAVRKFRSVEDMSQPVWRSPGDPQLYRAIREIWAFGQRTSSKRYRPGVHRFHSIVEMQESAIACMTAGPVSGIGK